MFKFVKKFMDLVEDLYPASNTSKPAPKPPAVSTESTISVIQETYPDIVFNLSQLSPDSAVLLNGINLNVFQKSYKQVTDLIIEAIELGVGFPPSKFDFSTVQLLPIPNYEDLNPSVIMLNPLTSTGKAPKYPVHIYFNCVRAATLRKFGTDNFFGTLDYYSTGIIGKARLVRWKNGSHFALNASEKSGNLSVQKIEFTDKQGIKAVLYTRK